MLACKARRLVIEADLQIIRLTEHDAVFELKKDMVLLDTQLEALAGRITKIINHIERVTK